MEGESVSGLLCEESETCLEEEEEEEEGEIMVDEETFLDISLNHGEDLGEDNYLEMLFEKEISFTLKTDQSMEFQNWVKCTRLEAINWILKSRASFGFRLQTAYLAMTFFDRFLSRRSIDREKSWAFKLLSVACLSLAAKMEELSAPSLPEFQGDDYNFESRVIQKMEILVLSTLEWRMISITPFVFLHYFFIKFGKESPSKDLVSTTVGFILDLMKEINLVDHRPSVIAIAATLMALDQSLTRQAMESKMSSISFSGLINNEDVFQCYSQIQKMGMENLRTPTLIKPTAAAVELRANDVLENSSLTCDDSTKRKRIDLGNSDENYDEKRQR